MHCKLTYITSLLFATLLMLSTEAQTFSPQSRFGIGNLHNNVFSGNKAMGGIAAGFRGTKEINYLNPASYASIEYTTFNLGLSLYGNVISDTALVTDAANGGIDHFALAFPIMQRKWGMAFGLLPYSYKNYTYNSSVSDGDLYYDVQNKGTGSLYKVFWGNGFQVKNFSAGFNTSFIFGELIESETIIFPDSSSNINSSINNQVNLKDVMIDFGFQYHKKINKLENEDKDKTNIYMTIGAYGAPSLNVKTLTSKYNSSSFTSVLTGNEIPLDSASNGVYDQKFQSKMPAYFGAGVAFGNELTWTTGVDFHFENWKNADSPISTLAMANEWKVKIGGQIRPNFKSKKYGSNVVYRLGAQFGKSRVMIDNQGVPELGMTFGFGLPFGKASKSFLTSSRLNVTLELGRRGIVSNDAYKENYYKVTVAYSLSDRWFIKRKFD